jgi:hypothetical protein
MVVHDSIFHASQTQSEMNSKPRLGICCMGRLCTRFRCAQLLQYFSAFVTNISTDSPYCDALDPCQCQTRLSGLFPFSLSDLHSLTSTLLLTISREESRPLISKPTAHSVSNLTHYCTNLPPVITREVPPSLARPSGGNRENASE